MSNVWGKLNMHHSSQLCSLPRVAWADMPPPCISALLCFLLTNQESHTILWWHGCAADLGPASALRCLGPASCAFVALVAWSMWWTVPTHLLFWLLLKQAFKAAFLLSIVFIIFPLLRSSLSRVFIHYVDLLFFLLKKKWHFNSTSNTRSAHVHVHDAVHVHCTWFAPARELISIVGFAVCLWVLESDCTIMVVKQRRQTRTV